LLTAFVGTNSLRGSQGIYTLAIDEHTAEMKIVRTIPAENSSYLCIDKDEKHLYATIESNSFHGIDGGGVSAYQIDEDGNLTFINEQPTYGKLPCYVDVESDYLYVSNYGEGTLVCYPLEQDGSIGGCERKISHLPSAQKVPHVHCSEITPDGEYICVLDCGIDAVAFYNAKGEHRYDLEYAFGTKDGSGPRHVCFSDDGNLAYIICETNSDINIYKYKKTAPGKMILIQQINTLPDDYLGWSVTSALRYSRDRSMMFASNRGDNSITCFRVDPQTGMLIKTSVVKMPGSFPRDFNLTPDGRFLIVGIQHDDKILAYEIDYQNGTLHYTGKQCDVPSPCCIIFHNDYQRK